MTELQQQAGNRNVARALSRVPSWTELWETAGDVGSQLIDQAMCFTLGASVGEGARNDAADVQRVRARLQSLGYPSSDDPASLTAAILRYQREVVGLKNPDGRIDPGGRTLGKLNDGAGPASTTSAPAPAPPAGPVPIPYPNTDAQPAPGPTVDTPAAQGAAAPAGASPSLTSVYAELDRVKALATAANAKAKELDKAAAKVADAKEKEKARVHTQETGQQRDDLVTAIKVLRQKVEALSTTDTGLTAADLKATKAALWREVARLAPFYYQMVNSDLLFREKFDKKKNEWVETDNAGGRTCNVTSLSMTLEALGKSSADYSPADKALIPYVYAHFTGRLDDTALDRVTKDPAGLRLPDFLQLLAVVKMMPKDAGAELAETNPTAFSEAVEKGRDEAVEKITYSGWFDDLVSGFGVKVENSYPFAGMKAGEIDYATLIDRVGEINRSSLPSALKAFAKENKKKTSEITDDERKAVAANVAKYFDENKVAGLGAAETKLTEREAALAAATKGKKKIEGEIKKLKGEIAGINRDQQIADLGINKAAADPTELDKIIPIAVYSKRVADALSAHLDQGHQIVGHMHGHFFRVESVEADGVIIDDPGTQLGKNKKLTWHEARAVGCFTRFSWVKPT